MATADEVRRAMNRLIEHRASEGKRPGPYRNMSDIEFDKAILADAYLAAHTSPTTPTVVLPIGWSSESTGPATPFDAEAFVHRVFAAGIVAAIGKLEPNGMSWNDRFDGAIKTLAAELAPRLRQPAGDDVEAVTEEWLREMGVKVDGLATGKEKIYIAHNGCHVVVARNQTRGQLRPVLSALGVGAKGRDE